MAIYVEFIALVYLNGLTILLSIIVQFVTFLSITKFDNMYSEAILENKILQAKNKKVKRYFYNSHIKLKELFDQEYQKSKFDKEFIKLEIL